MENGSLMKVESIAECSPFDLHSAIFGIENKFLFFLSGRSREVLLYITLQASKRIVLIIPTLF